MAAERTTAAEMMALTAVIVMAGAMLGLGRVGGGSGWRKTRHGTTSFDAPPLVRAATVSRDADFE